MTAYGFKVLAWLVFATSNLDQQPVFMPFETMTACEAASKKIPYRYNKVCVETN